MLWASNRATEGSPMKYINALVPYMGGLVDNNAMSLGSGVVLESWLVDR